MVILENIDSDIDIDKKYLRNIDIDIDIDIDKEILKISIFKDDLVRDIESQSHLHGITLTTPAGTPAFSQMAAFDQIMRTL